MKRAAPPFTFFLLHTSLAWPTGAVPLALGTGLVRAGVPVHQVSRVIAVTSLAFALEFVWAPLVDGALTRRVWSGIGSAVMCACLAAMLVWPWNAGSVPLLTALAFASCSGAAIAGVAAKGIMAYDVPESRLGRASGHYTAGGVFAKAAGGGGTLWLLTNLASRSSAAAISVGVAAVAGGAIVLVSPGEAIPFRDVRARMLGALRELWAFLRTREGLLVAAMCLLPFGKGTEAGLIGAISPEWRVSPNQLAGLGLVGAASNIAGATAGGWLSTRVGGWRAFVLAGATMIALMVVFAFAPRTATIFLVVELIYRGVATAAYAALLAVVMTAIGKGAASTKAAIMWSLVNFAVFYPTLIDGTVHDRGGTVAMLLTDAAVAAAGFGLLLAVRRYLAFRPIAPAPALAPSNP